MTRFRTCFPGAIKALSAAVLLLLLAGCGDSTGLAKRYPVSGKVTYKGAPLARGNINFIPTGTTPADRAATATIENGYYNLTTATENDGAFPGTYTVTITSTNVDLTEVKANQQGGAGRQGDVVRASRNAKSLIPTKYEFPDQSGLKAEVKPGSNSVDFALKD
jgi:hypothetical protein